MSSNRDKVLAKYAGGGEDQREKGSRAAGLEFRYTKKHLEPHIKKDSRVLELGCATGYYAMHFADRCRDYTGIDLSLDNIEVFDRKIKAAGLQNVRASVGDATDPALLPAGEYDVVLCLGPMYHLPREERRIVFDSCVRAAKPGAVIAFAYICGLGVYAGACVGDKGRLVYPNAKTNKCVFEYGISDDRPGLFHFTSPEEMEAEAVSRGLHVVKNAGVDFFFADRAINAMSEEQFGCWLELADRMSDSAFCTGLSNHALMICRK